MMLRKRIIAVVIFVLLLLIAIITGINLYLLIENLNTRDERVRNSVEQVIASIEYEKIHAPAQPVHTPVKNVDYFDGKNGDNGATGQNGKDGANGKDGINGLSIKGDTGAPGKDGDNGLTLEIRCNTKKNRWETKYVGDLNWRLMNNEVVKCTVDKEEGE